MQKDLSFLRSAVLFSEYQLTELKNYLKINPCPSAGEIEQLAVKINARGNKVRDWFIHYRCTSGTLPQQSSTGEILIYTCIM